MFLLDWQPFLDTSGSVSINSYMNWKTCPQTSSWYRAHQNQPLFFFIVNWCAIVVGLNWSSPLLRQGQPGKNLLTSGRNFVPGLFCMARVLVRIFSRPKFWVKIPRRDATLKIWSRIPKLNFWTVHFGCIFMPKMNFLSFETLLKVNTKFFNQKCFDSDKRMRYCAYTKSLAWALRRFNHGSPSGILQLNLLFKNHRF